MLLQKCEQDSPVVEVSEDIWVEDASGVLDGVLTDVPGIVVDEVAVSALVVLKFVENVVDRVVVDATPESSRPAANSNKRVVPSLPSGKTWLEYELIAENYVYMYI